VVKDMLITIILLAKDSREEIQAIQPQEQMITILEVVAALAQGEPVAQDMLHPVVQELMAVLEY
jgi:hypothetical protein